MASSKKYKCLWCEKRDYKDKLVEHIAITHKEMIPDGFTPLQVTFHIVNKHPLTWKKPCRVCASPCDWDEKKGRYNLLCNKKECHEAWAKKMDKDMGDKKGSNRQTQTEEGLKKMLAGRKISGKYKWSDGKEFTYVGSFEKATLEFMDKVMEIKSEDIMCPGPVLEYMLDGVKHLYITDIYYIPYNLIIEVKDGGNNPNTNPEMYESRKKKLAKEKYVIEETDYNYLRLTNKDFSQLLAVFADLKMSLVDKSGNRVVSVNESNINNESMVGSLQAAFPPAGTNGVYIVNYMQNNAFSGKSKFAVSDNPKFERLFTVDNEELKLESAKLLYNAKYSTYYSEVSDKKELFEYLIDNVGKSMTESDLYEKVLGHKLYLENQLCFEDSVIEYEDLNYRNKIIESSIINYIMGEE